MTIIIEPWLSEDEVLFHRMHSYHRMRVEEIAGGQSILGQREEGFLVAHLIARACVQTRNKVDGTKLKEHGSKISAFGDDGRYATTRFNVDGMLSADSARAPRSYVQINRDGRVEAVMTGIIFDSRNEYAQQDQQAANRIRYFRHTLCEMAMFKLVEEYGLFCQGIGLESPITLLSALVGCTGATLYSQWGDFNAGRTIDRSPAYLPEVELSDFGQEPKRLLRPWCDTLAQAMGLERSLNFDEEGNWKARQQY